MRKLWRSAERAVCRDWNGNECGLFIEHLSMPGIVYPDRRGFSTLLEFEWIQFMLDEWIGWNEDEPTI